MENDLIRRSELLAKKCVVRGHLDTGSPCPSKVVAIPVDVIERAPAIDAVEVVRCKYCSWRICWEKDDNGCDICWVSGMYVRGEDDFCSYGERKEGAEVG